MSRGCSRGRSRGTYGRSAYLGCSRGGAGGGVGGGGGKLPVWGIVLIVLFCILFVGFFICIIWRLCCRNRSQVTDSEENVDVSPELQDNSQ